MRHIQKKTYYLDPKGRLNSILIALLIFPLVYLIFEWSEKASFFTGVASGIFTAGLTLYIIQLLTLDFFVEVRAFRTLSSSLNRSCELIRPYSKSISIHLSNIFDDPAIKLDDRYKQLLPFDVSQEFDDLNFVLNEAECDKAMLDTVELTNQRMGEGPQRYYLGLVTEIKRLQPVLLAASFHLSPDCYSVESEGKIDATYYERTVGATFTSLMKSHSDLDKIFYELDNLEYMLMNDSRDETRVRLRVKVKQFYHAVIIYQHSLKHLSKLNNDLLNGEFLTSVRKGRKYLV